MQSSEEEEEEELPVEEAPPKRGRPAGRADEKPRYRRTAQQISEDKIRIAEMKLQAVRDTEEKRAEKKAEKRESKRNKPAVSESPLPVKPVVMRAPPAREESPPPPKSRRASLYDSWFPSSPQSKRSVY